MRPTTPHYVLTVEDAIVYGCHFFPISAIQSSVFGVIHCFIHRYSIINQLHNNVFTCLWHLMAMWYSYYKDPTFEPSQHQHIPNIMTENGLLDVMTLGNLVEVAPILDCRSYKASGIHHLEWSEMGYARWIYRMLQSNISRRFSFKVGNKFVPPLLIFRRSLLEFAAAIVTYMQDTEDISAKNEACNALKLKEKMVTFFDSNYPELLSQLHHHINNGVEYLCWRGPKITITKRSEEDRPLRPQNQEIRDPDFTDSPLYPARIKENIVGIVNTKIARERSPDSARDSDHITRPAKRLRGSKRM